MDQNFYDVFLSHNSQDKPAVRALRDRLVAQGCEVFFDDKDLLHEEIAGSQIDEVFEQTSVFAGCWGPAGVGRYHKAELDIAFNNYVQYNSILVTVILPEASPKDPSARFRSFPPIVFTSIQDAAPLKKILAVVDRARAEKGLPPRVVPGDETPKVAASPAQALADTTDQDQTQQIVRQLRRDARQFGMNFLLGPLTGIERPTEAVPVAEVNAGGPEAGEPSPYELAHLLPDEQNALPLDDTTHKLSLQTVASWMTIHRSDPRLVQDRLRSILRQRRLCNSAFYDLFAQVMGVFLEKSETHRRRRTPPPLIFTTNFGTNLEWKLIYHGVPFTRITVKLPDTLDVQRIHASLQGDNILLSDMNDDGSQPMILPRSEPESEVRSLSFLADSFNDSVERFAALASRRLDVGHREYERPVTTRGLSFDEMDGVILFKYHGSVDVDDSCVVNNEQLFELTRTEDLVPAAVEERLKIAPTVVFGSSFLLTEVQQAAEAVWRAPFNSKRINRYVVPRRNEGLTDRDRDGWLMQLEEGMRHSLKTHANKFNLTEVSPGQIEFLKALKSELAPDHPSAAQQMTGTG